MQSNTTQNESQPTKNGTPQTVCKGVHLDTPANSSAGSPTDYQGLSDYQDRQGLSGLSGTKKDSQGVGVPPTCVSLFDLPWDKFLVEAYRANQDRLADIESDYDFNSPDGDPGCSAPWQLQTPLFRFTHLVWSRPDLGADAHRPAVLFAKIESTLKQWSTNCKRKKQEPPNGFTGDCWEDWFGVCREEAKTEFLDLWPKFRWPAWQTPLDAAVLLARRTLLLPSEEICQRRMIERNNPTDGYCFFLSVCGHLQVMLGDQPIFLPQEALAKLLRVQGRTVSRWRQWAVVDGFLHQTAKPGRRKAAEYRFDISRWPVLRDKAARGTAEGFSE